MKKQAVTRRVVTDRVRPLELQQSCIDQIRAGIAQADAGKLVSHRRVKAMAARWRENAGRDAPSL
jgi:predicted transcriptional regulator